MEFHRLTPVASELPPLRGWRHEDKAECGLVPAVANNLEAGSIDFDTRNPI
jgi:hypothetical protein